MKPKLNYILLMLFTLCIAGSSQAARTIAADAQTLFGQKVQSFTVLDDQNLVSKIEVVLPFAALFKAAGEPTSVTLALPGEVIQQTSFSQAVIRWEPQGRGPADSIPLFNLRFLGEAPQGKVFECISLEPKNLNDWTLPFAPHFVSTQPCLSSIGFQAASPDEPGDQNTVNVKGFIAGKANFSEPVFNKMLLESKQNFELMVPLPQYLNRPVLHPRKLVATYEASTDSYTFALKDFVQLTPWKLR